MRSIHTYEKGKLIPGEAAIVREYPLVLHVNGRELATLVASPHDLRFLVAGFLRLQGFVSTVDDFDLLSVCEDVGVANVRIKKEVPDRLRPVLTSGCGTGVTFSLEAQGGGCGGQKSGGSSGSRFPPDGRTFAEGRGLQDSWRHSFGGGG